MKHQGTKATKDLEEQLSYVVIGAALEVHRALGPGLLESAYEACLHHELLLRGVRCRRQVPVPLRYKGVRIGLAYRMDLIVEDLVLVELKAVEKLPRIALTQLLTNLRLVERRLGLLINFHEDVLRRGIRRVVNGW